MGPIRMSKLEASIRAVLEFKEAFNRHDVGGMMKLVSDDCILETPDPAPDGTVHSGKDGLSRSWQNFFSNSPQAHIEIEEIFSFGERCIMRWIYSWVDTAGGKGHIRGVDIFRVRNDFICEQLSYVKG